MMPFGFLYGALVNSRNALYEKGFLKSFSPGAPVISIGNITVGGTGKTPMVAFVTEILAERGEKICILTRGYGRENPGERVLVTDGEKILAGVKKAGDEPLELARKLLGKAIIVADKNRAEAGIWAREKFGITAFILDDGFQHLRIRRDLDIVCVDATNPFGNGKLLPGGILREPLQNLKRADAFVITRANLAENLETVKSQISKFNAHSPIFTARNKISDLIELNEFHAKSQKSKTEDQDFKARNSLAFCALGNPKIFFEHLRQNNFKIILTETFSDHHFYTQKDIENLELKAKSEKIEYFLTTAKDAVKLGHLRFAIPCYVVENKVFLEDDEKFRQIIYAKIQR